MVFVFDGPLPTQVDFFIAPILKKCFHLSLCLCVAGFREIPRELVVFFSIPPVAFINTDLTMVLRLSLRRGMSVLLTILVLGLVGYASTPIAVQIYF